MVGRGIRLGFGVLALAGANSAEAQGNLDQGKTAARLYASACRGQVLECKLRFRRVLLPIGGRHIRVNLAGQSLNKIACQPCFRSLTNMGRTEGIHAPALRLAARD